MKIFLSWSGKQSHGVAAAFREWLPNVFPTVDPFLSSADIEAGERWARRIDDVLQEYNFGIVCVTRNNTTAPWLLFEAGALAKKLPDSRLVPILCGITPTELTHNPLTNFQCITLDKPEVFKLIKTINDALEQGKIAVTRLETTFDKWWPDLEKLIHALEPDTPVAKKPFKIEPAIEEILATVRSISRAVDRSPNLHWSAAFQPSAFEPSAFQLPTDTSKNEALLRALMEPSEPRPAYKFYAVPQYRVDPEILTRIARTWDQPKDAVDTKLKEEMSQDDKKPKDEEPKKS